MSYDVRDSNSIAGIAGGILCSMMVAVRSEEVTKSIVLAAVGAVVSFGVTVLLKQLWAWCKKGNDE